MDVVVPSARRAGTRAIPRPAAAAGTGAAAGRPAWWFHPLGIEAKRARHRRDRADRRSPVGLGAASTVGARGQAATGPGHRRLDGRVGARPGAATTTPCRLATTTCPTSSLEPRRRGGRRRMLELLEPFRGHRGRVIRPSHWPATIRRRSARDDASCRCTAGEVRVLVRRSRDPRTQADTLPAMPGHVRGSCLPGIRLSAPRP